ncbi:centrosomal protein of 104 kDa [Dermacentor variabilis]|uniref:centrosomal protein of 104 kDa n=1 Tax=Dermacentor variabilis TaxID=34621 RepID=UPI003F5C5EC1
MPRKINFSVVQVSAEDENFPASELNLHGPTVKGWLSKKYSTYPQEIVIQMETKCRICRIQILSHQYCIATTIDIYVGNVPKGLDVALYNARWTHLGEVSLADNLHSEYKSRELKSVLVDAIGDFVKFLIHANHVNKYNVYNQVPCEIIARLLLHISFFQVGIVALNVIGDDVQGLDGSEEDEKTTWQTIIKRNEEISPMDDLAFDMYVDTEVAQILRKLEAKKRDAIAEERFVFAKKLKNAVVELQKVGEKLGKMVIEKQMAVEMEDFDRARQKKQHIEEYRLNAYEHLRLPELMEMEGYNPERDSALPGPVPPPEKVGKGLHVSMDPQLEGSGPGRNAGPTEQRVVSQQQQQQQQSAPRPTATKAPKNSYLALENRLVAGARKVESEEDGKELVLGRMSLRDRQEAALPIEVFGLRLVQKLYSKNFIQREEAFKEIQRFLERYNSRRSRHSAEDVLKAVTFLLRRGARDKVLSVFIQALNLMQTLFTRFTIVQRISKGDVTAAINKTVPRILYRTGDTAPRVKSVAIDFLLEMGDYEDVKAVQAMLHIILRPFPESTNPRLAQGRCELVEQLVARFPPLSQSDPLFEHMMAFAIRALSHPSLQVREVAEQILLSLYRLLGTPVRQCLVPESTKTSRNFTYKKVFEEFEKIDKEPGSAQRPPRRQRSASADSPSSGSGRRDFVKEVAAPSSRSLQELPKASQQDQSTLNLDKMCMFCEETNEKFNAETLNYHYWTECPMLMLCYNCKQVVEISGLTRHLLEECVSRSQYRLCIRCKEAIAKTRFEGHVKLKTCVLAKPPHQANHCPLCHQNFAPGDDAWKVHLMSEVGCAFNPRRRNKFFRWRSGSVWEPEYSVTVPDSMAGKLKILGALPPEYRQYTLHHSRSKSEPAPAKRSSGTQTNDEDDEPKAQ